MARISIIIPVYNAEKYLDACLQSIENQTFRDYQIIAIEDQSTDNSFEILKKHEEKDKHKIVVLQNPKNMGAGSSRNRGLQVADSEYIGFVDSDDKIHETMYQSLWTASQETNADIARGNRFIVYNNLNLSMLGRDGNYHQKRIIVPKEELDYTSREYPSVTNKLFKRELIGDSKFPEDLKWEDYPFCIPKLFHADKVVTVPEAEYYYRVNINGTTMKDARKIPKQLLDIFTASDRIIEEVLKDYPTKEIEEQLNFIAIQNSLQRMRDILFSNVSYKQKKELLAALSALITKKYGAWQTNSYYQIYKKNRFAYQLRMDIIEKIIESSSKVEGSEEELTSSIQKILKK